GVRGRIRLVTLGGTLSLLLLVMLFIIPDALLGQTILSYSYSFFFLAILPLTYGYAIFRYRLIEIEKHVNRGATYILVYSILGVFYLVVYFSLRQLLPETPSREPLINTLLVLILASMFIPLHQRVQVFVDTAFYGGWYNYRSAISEITQGLERFTELAPLADTVSVRMRKILRLEEVCVFLSDLEGSFSVVAIAPSPPAEALHAPYMPLPRTSLSYLLNMGTVVERNVLRKALSETTLSPEEHSLLNSEQMHLWVPIIGHGHVLGLFALGAKFGGDIFSGEDADILRVVARQMAPLIENVHLVTRLRQHAATLEINVAQRTEELNAAKKRVEAILASVGEGVIVTDLRGQISEVNAAYEAQTGFHRDELLGRVLWDLYDPASGLKLESESPQFIQHRQGWQGDLLAIHKDGGYYDVSLTVTALRDDDGGIAGYVGSQRDISQQKELDRLKDMFVSDVSHELRTPTTNISLYLDLLDTAPATKHAHYMQVLKEQSRLLMKLVEDILDLSRLASGKKATQDFGPVDLNLLVEQVVTAHRAQAEAQGLILFFEPGGDLPGLWGDSGQLVRLVNNLVSNAIHYTPQGGVYLNTCKKGGEVVLEVRDTGLGIEPEDRPHLFERFYRGQNVRQSKIHGTGLGLAIVKEIAKLHDCRIEMESDAGKGAVFFVRFPIPIGEEWLTK
ncbi:MAG: ATP-binding protein, partial [Chloroflexi bacterium]|nr:ATP-binding protein [Chloroflexota bacterium]